MLVLHSQQVVGLGFGSILHDSKALFFTSPLTCTGRKCVGARKEELTLVVRYIHICYFSRVLEFIAGIFSAEKEAEASAWRLV